MSRFDAMRIALGVLFILHGIAHLPGFLGAWQLDPKIPHTTTVLNGTFEVGEAGIRAIGVLWLLTGVAFAVAAVTVFANVLWWPPAAFGVALASLVLCVLGWPLAKFGVPINLAILGGVYMGQRLGWFHHFG